MDRENPALKQQLHLMVETIGAEKTAELLLESLSRTWAAIKELDNIQAKELNKNDSHQAEIISYRKN